MTNTRLLAIALLVALGSPLVAQSPRVTATKNVNGTLARGDETLEDGEYVDTYTYRWEAGQRVTIELTSKDFDGYLVLAPPKGDQIDNDDADEDDSERSVIETDLTVSGEYEVMVTSYEKGETGAYTLRVAASAPRRTVARPANLPIGKTLDEELEQDDQLIDDRYVDSYTFNAKAGERITIEMSADELDTFLTLIPPDGAEIENDDAGSDTNRSAISLTLRETGQYRVLATSYDSRETGPYRLTLRREGTRARDPEPPARSGAAIYGVFIGISDYEGDDNDLEYTAADAGAIAQALSRGAGMRSGDAATIVDRAATRANVRRAIEEIGRRVGPDDLFVLFFSGHGDRVERDRPQPSDPDGVDETISLYDGDITDDELSTLLAPIRGRVVLALDSCFSGGFAKDVISSPRRMGLFSSEEDVTSGVADKFRAGGYLSKFLADGIGDRRSDRDRDGTITAIELSQYLHERYRADVKSSKSATENIVSTGRDTGYQHLVVDRGSIGPFEVLFGK
jgi:hypothetical protein